ncbi:MAG: hypothetical protein HZA17_08390 [Nitrospirae bacterium]|nr:hypothetical protein [Nitrospirota bacterium]
MHKRLITALIFVSIAGSFLFNINGALADSSDGSAAGPASFLNTAKPPEKADPPLTPQLQAQPPVQGLPPVPQPQPQHQIIQPSQPTAPQPVQPPTATQPQPATFFQPPVKPAVSKRGDVSFNFDDADVYSVIQTIFGDVLKVNYIVDPSVKGRVNFRSIAPVAKEDVLPLMEVILRISGIGIVEEGGLYRIVPIADISREPSPVGIGRESGKVEITGRALVQVVPVRYVQSSEMVRVLSPFLSKTAVIIDVPKSNYIIISDTDANVKRLLQLVEIFDSEQLRQVTPQVFVYPVQNSKAKDVASLLQQIFLGQKSAAPKTAAATPARTPFQTQTPAAGQPAAAQQPQVSMGQAGGEALVSETTRIIPDEITNSIVILSTPEDYALIYDTIQKIDIVPRQVMIEALVAEVKLVDNLRFGLQWTIQNDLNIKGIKPFAGDTLNLSGPLEFVSKISSPTLTFTAIDLANKTKLLVQALADDNKAKVLSFPHILVSDNREARIQVGDQIPIATSTTTTPLSGTTATNTTTATIQYKDTGTILKVKPQVNDSGLVALEITQEVSKGTTISVLGTEQFVVTKREVTTNLVAQDGQTIVIGGLIDETSSKGRSGIPFLSKIPILGYFFGSTIDDTSRTELIILLTPHVIRNQQEAQGTTSNYLNRFRDNTKMKIEEFTKDNAEKEKSKEDAAGSGAQQVTPR